MKKQRGFTLIELLAVIVILAIIALIAVPIVLNMVEKARKSAAISSTYGYIDAIDYSIGLADYYSNISYNNPLENMMLEIKTKKLDQQQTYVDLPDNTTEKPSYTVAEIEAAGVKVKGQKPSSGTVVIEKRKVKQANIEIGGYRVAYDGKKAEIEGKSSSSESESEQSETAQGTIESCPGCVFLITRGSYVQYGDDGDYLEKPTVATTSGDTTIEYCEGPYEKVGDKCVLAETISSDYTQLKDGNGEQEQIFSGVITDSSGKITRAFACGIREGTPFCIEGTSDGSKNTSNLELLNGSTLWNGTCEESNKYGNHAYECVDADVDFRARTGDAGDVSISYIGRYHYSNVSNGVFSAQHRE